MTYLIIFLKTAFVETPGKRAHTGSQSIPGKTRTTGKAVPTNSDAARLGKRAGLCG
jgi:hypothetical protein